MKKLLIELKIKITLESKKPIIIIIFLVIFDQLF